MIQSLFVFIAVLGLLSALGTVLARNLVHAALFLIAYFFVVACVFVLLEAEFLAAIQVLVYIGAVAILVMFGIMLTRNIKGDDTTIVPGSVVVPTAIATLALFGILCFGIANQANPLDSTSAWSRLENRPPSDAAGPDGTPAPRSKAIADMGRVVGYELVNRYAVAFEVAGLLLTAALVGAVALAHREEGEDDPFRKTAAEASAAAVRNGSDSHEPAAAGSSSHA